jgi:hypothetical protein
MITINFSFLDWTTPPPSPSSIAAKGEGEAVLALVSAFLGLLLLGFFLSVQNLPDWLINPVKDELDLQ